jgi:hypothetical protein
MNIWDGIPMPVFCMYIMFIDTNWLWINLVVLGLAAVGFFISITCLVESPKWLLINGYREQAIENLNYICRMNGGRSEIPKDARFVEELAVGLKK